MTIHYLDGSVSPGRHSPASRAFFAYSFLLRAGFVALSVAAIALIMLADGQASAPAAIAGAMVGGLVAFLAWRKAWTLIGRDEGTAPADAVPAAAQPRRAGLVARVETAAAR
jgi:hypothetical protein